MDPSPLRPLEYAPPPPWRRRRSFRRGAAILLLAAAAAATWHWGPPVWRHARVLYLQRQFLTYTAPPDRVVYDDDPNRAAVLLAQPGYTNGATPGQPPVAVYRPPTWDEATRIAGSPLAGQTTQSPNPIRASAAAVLFLHERESPGGQRRLVVLCAVPEASRLSYPLVVFPVLVEPGSLKDKPRVVVPAYTIEAAVRILPLGMGPSVRYFAGQPDPADRSHFTVRFESAGLTGTIDGWLDDNDRVRLDIRTDPAGDPVGGTFGGTFEFTPDGNTSTTLSGTVTASVKVTTVPLATAPTPTTQLAPQRAARDDRPVKSE